MTNNGIKVGGGVIFFTLSEFTRREPLLAGLEVLGLQKFCPEPRTSFSALSESLGRVYPGENFTIERLAKRDGFAVLAVQRSEDSVRTHQELVARIDPQTLQISCYPYNQEIADNIVSKYNEGLGLLRASQISQAMVNILDSLGGTRLRPNGAIYWLPEYQLGQWQNVANLVENCAAGRRHDVYLLRHQMDADAIRAVRDAIVAEVSQEAHRIDQEVNEGDLGDRALESRKHQAEELRDKILLYERLLGMALEGLHEAVDKAEVAACKAVLLASSAEG